MTTRTREAAAQGARTAALTLSACALVWLLSACEIDQGEPQRVTPGDAALFASSVQPYLGVNCASLDCHGVEGRPLRLYSELGLRRDAALRATPVAEGAEPAPITVAELEDNQLALAGVSAGTQPPSSQLTLRKPLALAAGGYAHEGGVHWPTKADPGYLCLRGYLVGDVADVSAVCTEALAATAP